MRKIAYYSLLEVLAVIGMIMLMGGTLYTAFHRYNRDFQQKSIAITGKEIFQIAQQFRRAINDCTTPLELSVQEVCTGDKVIAAVVSDRIELLIDGKSRFLKLSKFITAEISMEEDNRLVVLTLTEKIKPGNPPRSYRIAAAAGVKP